MKLSNDQIDEQAARWTSRLDGGDLKQADRLMLDAWLDEDPAHRKAFEYYQMICDDTADALPALATVSVLAMPEPKLRRKIPWRLSLSIGLAACLAAAFWVVPLMRNTGTVQTIASQRSNLTLPDGSKAEMNARTRLYTDFRHDRRFVRLESGEAFFSIARDPEHPFLVETAAGVVRVLGTHFNVRLDTTGHAEITLVDGSVAFENGAGRIKLAAGDQLSLGGDLKHLTGDEVDNLLAWRQGRIVLNGLSLAEAAARFAAFHGKTITVAPEVAALEMGGSYSLDDLHGFFDALSDQRLRLKIVRHSNDDFAIVAR